MARAQMSLGLEQNYAQMLLQFAEDNLNVRYGPGANMMRLWT